MSQVDIQSLIGELVFIQSSITVASGLMEEDYLACHDSIQDLLDDTVQRIEQLCESLSPKVVAPGTPPLQHLTT